MNQPTHIDLARLAFDEFVQFFFDHAESEQFWYADPRYALADTSISSPLLVEHLTTLFLKFAATTSKYSPAQISHAIVREMCSRPHCTTAARCPMVAIDPQSL